MRVIMIIYSVSLMMIIIKIIVDMMMLFFNIFRTFILL
jgi:hypothetical protein